MEQTGWTTSETGASDDSATVFDLGSSYTGVSMTLYALFTAKGTAPVTTYTISWYIGSDYITNTLVDKDATIYLPDLSSFASQYPNVDYITGWKVNNQDYSPDMKATGNEKFYADTANGNVVVTIVAPDGSTVSTLKLGKYAAPYMILTGLNADTISKYDYIDWLSGDEASNIVLFGSDTATVHLAAAGDTGSDNKPTGGNDWVGLIFIAVGAAGLVAVTILFVVMGRKKRLSLLMKKENK
jgi:hypothetical protein